MIENEYLSYNLRFRLRDSLRMDWFLTLRHME